ncbi:hypothetical protein [Flavobacterium aestivum]|uniref:hypothetical protein n=1 Tax=Flavobacterium aestivum TaxID=3003257 RepID=UPI0024825BC7|nr:hypothetical protein [Flavobacterium aestivum]
MKNKLQRIAKVALCCFLLITLGCENDNPLTAEDAKMIEAKNWFNHYESNGINYELFQKTQYDWNQAKITKSQDGTETIIVPIIELKQDKKEIWEQKLYLYKLDTGNYKALLFEIYPDKNAEISSQTIDGGDFNGYITTWDIKTGFVRAAKFVDNQVVENGIAKPLSIDKVTGKAPPVLPCQDGDCNTGVGGGNPIPLRPVIITGPSTGTPVVYMPRNPVTGGTNTGGFTSPSGGGVGGGGVTLIMPPPPEIPISDIIKFLSCFNKSANVNLTVYAENMNLSNKNVGHAFISISQGNNTMVFGYYPKNGGGQAMTGPGIMGENGGHRYDVSANMGQISPQKLQQIITLSEKYQNSFYDLGFNNCSDFATQVLNIAGVSSSGWIDTPNTVADILATLPNHTSNSTYAPKTQRTCP